MKKPITITQQVTFYGPVEQWDRIRAERAQARDYPVWKRAGNNWIALVGLYKLRVYRSLHSCRWRAMIEAGILYDYDPRTTKNPKIARRWAMERMFKFAKAVEKWK